MNFKQELLKAEKLNQYRSLSTLVSQNSSNITVQGKELINLGSNNYLNMIQSKRVLRAFVKNAKLWGVGSGASRLVTGTLSIHQQLEKELALFSKKEDSLVFPSGYMANLGLISTITSKDDLIILDKIDHASIIDGSRLSQASVRVFPHKNLKYLEDILQKSGKYSKKIIVVDSIFSMDGDASDLKELVRLKKKYKAWLVVDEAHAVGVFGENGCGLADEKGVISEVDFKVGTLSKAFGLQGGYIASSYDAIDYLKNRCRSFIYTTSITPAICGAAIEVVNIFKNYQKQRTGLLEKARWLETELSKMNLKTCNTVSQIIPIVIGGEAETLDIQLKLQNKGFFVPAIRYPTVKKGTERLRISLTLDHSKKDLKRFLRVLEGLGIKD